MTIEKANLFKRERKDKKSIGQGYNKGQLYYGTTIEDPNNANRKLTAVITSNRECYIAYNDLNNEIKNNFGIHYNQDFCEDAIDFKWTRNSIYNWLTKDYKVDIKILFDTLVDINSEYIIYEDKRFNKLIVLDMMKTYWFQLFPANARTHFHAGPGSGKTNQLAIYDAFSFNPIMSTDFSSASIYRIIESTCASILIDDFEELEERDKLALLRHIKVNYKPFNTLRADGGKSGQFTPTAYLSYSHVVFNNVLGLGGDWITSQRTITIRLLKHPEAKNKTFNQKDAKWITLRDDMYIMGLQYFKEVMKNYNSIDGNVNIKARELEIIKPILAIAKTIGEELFQEMLTLYTELTKREKVKDLNEDFEFLLIKYLWEMVRSNEDPDKKTEIQVAPIAQYIIEHSGTERKKRKSIEIKIGHTLRSYTNLPNRCLNGISIYSLTKNTIKVIMESKEYTEHIIGKGDKGDIKDKGGLIGLGGFN